MCMYIHTHRQSHTHSHAHQPTYRRTSIQHIHLHSHLYAFFCLPSPCLFFFILVSSLLSHSLAVSLHSPNAQPGEENIINLHLPKSSKGRREDMAAGDGRPAWFPSAHSLSLLLYRCFPLSLPIPNLFFNPIVLS